MPSVNPGPSSTQTSNVVSVISDSTQQVPFANDIQLQSVDMLGLTKATQTQSQVIEASLLNSGSSLILAQFTSGPGILTKLHFIAFSSTANFNGAKGLLFSFYVDGESTPSLQFDGDLWSAGQFPNVTNLPSVSTPIVLETDHLTVLMGKDGSNDIELELFFKYPVPFSSSLTITVLNQSYASASFNTVWSGADAQIGLNSPRRLRSAFTNYNSPLNIPSAADWISNYTTSGGYAVGNLVTDNSALYQCTSAISGGTTAPHLDPTHWSAVSAVTNPNFNTGWTLLQVAQPCWIAHFSLNGQGTVSGGPYGSVNTGGLTFLESNVAIYDGNLSPALSFPGISPSPTYNSSGTEDFMGGSFYWNSVGSAVQSSITVSGTPQTIQTAGKTAQLRHGYCMSNGSAFMGANVDLIALCGGIRCGTSCVMRWEEGNLARGSSGPITPGNTWKINPTILYYV